MTRRSKILVSFFVAAFVASAVAAAIASANMVLPVFSGTAAKVTGTSGEAALSVEGGAKLKCGSGGSTELGFESGSRHLGPFIDWMLTTCTQGGEPCFTLGDLSGVFLYTGTWHLVLRAIPFDIYLFLFLFKLIHVECPNAPVKLFLVSGSSAGEILPKPGSTTRFEYTVQTVRREGKLQEFSEFENEAGTGVKTAIEVEEEGGKAKKALDESPENTLTFESATSIEK
jgi:hypothetical protein